jgi:hypothetical protein
MNHGIALLAPLALMLPGGGASPAGAGLASAPMVRSGVAGLPVAAPAPAQPEVARQVRIEQHFFIRITPGGPAVPPQMQVELQQQEEAPTRYEEHRLGKCVAIGSIGAVQGGEGNRLLLFMRDQHIISAMLEKACQARDFYSGFYVERNADGLICADRDTLQSRSGANCKLKRLYELLPAAWRRFP